MGSLSLHRTYILYHYHTGVWTYRRAGRNANEFNNIRHLVFYRFRHGAVVLCKSRSLGIGIWATVATMEDPNIIAFNEKYRWSVMFYALGTIIDFTIAVSLCYFLAKLRKTSIKRTVRLIDGLIAWTIETGAATGLNSISLIICFGTMPDNFIWVAIYCYMDRLYSNSWLAILNSRTPQNGMEQVVLDSSNTEWTLSTIAPRSARTTGTETTQQLDTGEPPLKQCWP